MTSQGVRAGAATDLAEAGVRGKALNRAGRWREDSHTAEEVYVRPLDGEQPNPFAAVSPRAGLGQTSDA